MRTIPASELIINDDGSIFHLHLRPEQMADTIILVGDPGRVALVAQPFETRACEVSNREFRAVTGPCPVKRMTVRSTGIGIGNIDICVTELDALANVDFATRQEKAQKRQLTLVRLGTSGALQPDIRIGEFLFSRTSCGFDGLLSYYKGRDAVCNLALEEAFVRHTGWYEKMPRPYFVDADKTLFEHFRDTTREGITIAAPGAAGRTRATVTPSLSRISSTEIARTPIFTSSSSIKSILPPECKEPGPTSVRPGLAWSWQCDSNTRPADYEL